MKKLAQREALMKPEIIPHGKRFKIKWQEAGRERSVYRNTLADATAFYDKLVKRIESGALPEKSKDSPPRRLGESQEEDIRSLAPYVTGNPMNIEDWLKVIHASTAFIVNNPQNQEAQRANKAILANASMALRFMSQKIESHDPYKNMNDEELVIKMFEIGLEKLKKLSPEIQAKVEQLGLKLISK